MTVKPRCPRDETKRSPTPKSRFPPTREHLISGSSSSSTDHHLLHDSWQGSGIRSNDEERRSRKRKNKQVAERETRDYQKGNISPIQWETDVRPQRVVGRERESCSDWRRGSGGGGGGVSEEGGSTQKRGVLFFILCAGALGILSALFFTRQWQKQLLT